MLDNPIPSTQRIFHIGGPAMNEFEMNQLIAKALGASPDLIQQQKSTEEEFEGLRVNPKRDYSLNCDLFQKTFGWKPETKEKLIAAMKSHLTPHQRELNKAPTTLQNP